MDRHTIDNNFTYHPPQGDEQQYYERLRKEAKTLAYSINSLCPEGREKSLAITKLEECIMWANASIARYEA